MSIRNELLDLLNTPSKIDFWKDYGYTGSARSIYQNLFRYPVDRLFYWEEEDFSGSLFVVYTYKSHYIAVKGGFGSCSGCDHFEGTVGLNDLQRKLVEIVDEAQISENPYQIEIGEYSHPDLRRAFSRFLETI